MKISLVAIVGRPNVGKSTLFNRLVGKREAIVDDVSGVTRDRNYGEVEWSGKTFRLIDTGGYVPESDEIFEKAIREQVEHALVEADKILFVVDARTGLMPLDYQIAELIRRSGKKSYLLVNKIDSEFQEHLTSDFYPLGLGEPISVSALSGRRIGDFLDDLTVDFPLNSEEDLNPNLKLSIVGRPNVGKSTLTNALLGEERSIVTDIPGTTRDSIHSHLKYYGEEITLIDTAGLRKRSRINDNIEYFSMARTLKAIADSDVTVVLLDAEKGMESQDHYIIDEAIRRKRGLIIAVNKWDLLEKDSKTADKYRKSLIKKLGMNDYIPIVFISAIEKQRIYKLIDLAKEIHSERKKVISTDRLNDDLLPEIEKMPPPASPTGREIKIKYITQGGLHYPVFLFFTNYPKNIPDNYKRFLEKLIRKLYGFKGVPLTLVFRQK